MKIMVLKEHHGNRYLDVSTYERQLDVALSIIKGRFSGENDYYPLEEEDETPLEEPALSREEVEKLKDGFTKNAARQDWKYFDSCLLNHKKQDQMTQQIKNCIATNNKELALQILERRRDYEDEGFEVVEVEEEYKP